MHRAFVKFIVDKNIKRGSDKELEPYGYRNLASELTRRFATISFEMMMDEDAAYKFIEQVWAERDMEKTSVGHPISKEAPLFKFKVTDTSLIKETSAGIYNGKLAVNLGFPINNNLNQNDLSRIWAVESLKSKKFTNR